MVEPSRSHLPPMPRWLVPAVVAVVLLISGGLVWVLLWGLDTFEHLTDSEHATARLDVVKIGLTVAGGGGALFALWLGVRRQRAVERDSEDRYAAQTATERDATERRITELYGRAVDQLGSDKAAVRLGGLYALERLANDHEQLRQTVVNVLCAYLRMHNAEDGQVRLTAQKILGDHLRGEEGIFGVNLRPNPRFWGELEVDLSEAKLVDFDLTNARLKSADFENTVFIGRLANFVGVVVVGDANFAEAEFRAPAHFHHVSARGFVAFDHAKFASGAVFADAEFWYGVTFYSAGFMLRAEFDGVNFGLVGSFEGAAFREGASFCGSVFDTFPNFSGVVCGGSLDFSNSTVMSSPADGGSPPDGWTVKKEAFADDGGVDGVRWRVVRNG
ncbi:pentapeptide repeat-containing protein [Kutzneria chonburiensis]|uniref:Pentapeptide repeat-containing protein n=1 Tax=Kutzneria chonburiensis TaxID=1483604 RepID=A0ABV6MQB0_9PSEU|nr:pentapeptide repeat-containing protein [Kutzneria chonburiensis]